jgi:hypothetical protein
VRLVVGAELGALVMAVLVGTSACTASSDSGSSTAQLPTSAPTSDAGDVSDPTEAGQVFTLAGPGLVVALPHGWHKDSLPELRSQLAAQAQQSPPSIRRILLDLVHRIRAGIIVGEATGPVGAADYRPSLYLSIESGDASLAAAATRRTHYLQDTGDADITWRVVDRRPVSLPVGRAIRVVAHSPVPPGTDGVPSQSVEYVLLVDGSTVSIAGTAPTADHDFVDTMDGLANAVTRS